MAPRILVTGAAGMLGHRVVEDARARGWDVVGIDLPDGDLTDAEVAIDLVAGESPDAVIHCAAYTAVDKAEEDEATALRVNADASANVAAGAATVGARIVAVSTDYVFDGTLRDRPYVESDATGPLGAYGRTKLAGEQAVIGHNDNHAIARTAWLFGVGGPNFVDTMLNAAQTRDEVAVVTDQTGSPTFAGHLSPALLDLAVLDATGIFHTAGGGQCTWHALTVEAYKLAGITIPVNETDSTAFVRPAPRPGWSVLASERDETPRLPPWQDGVAQYLTERGNAS